ncbi:unnamed protein product, partial [Trichobilharzia regenti]
MESKKSPEVNSCISENINEKSSSKKSCKSDIYEDIKLIENHFDSQTKSENDVPYLESKCQTETQFKVTSVSDIAPETNSINTRNENSYLSRTDFQRISPSQQKISYTFPTSLPKVDGDFFDDDDDDDNDNDRDGDNNKHLWRNKTNSYDSRTYNISRHFIDFEDSSSQSEAFIYPKTSHSMQCSFELKNYKPNLSIYKDWKKSKVFNHRNIVDT